MVSSDDEAIMKQNANWNCTIVYHKMQQFNAIDACFCSKFVTERSASPNCKPSANLEHVVALQCTLQFEEVPLQASWWQSFARAFSHRNGTAFDDGCRCGPSSRSWKTPYHVLVWWIDCVCTMCHGKWNNSTREGKFAYVCLSAATYCLSRGYSWNTGKLTHYQAAPEN